MGNKAEENKVSPERMPIPASLDRTLIGLTRGKKENILSLLKLDGLEWRVKM